MLGIIFLAPVNYIGDNGAKGLARLYVSNIREGSPLLMVHAASVYTFSGIFMASFWKFCKKVRWKKDLQGVEEMVPARTFFSTNTHCHLHPRLSSSVPSSASASYLELTLKPVQYLSVTYLNV